MKNNKTGKIIGGFLAGAGIITYIMASKNDASCKAKKAVNNLANSAEDKIDDAKDGLSRFADHVMDFIASNRPMVEGAVSSIFKAFKK